MALKILTAIGTDRGITNEAYVRISNYQISKYGSASFIIEIYHSQDDVLQVGHPIPTPLAKVAQNQQIGNSLTVPMTKEVTNIITVKELVSVQVEKIITDVDGNETTQTLTEMQEKDVEKTTVTTVLDMSLAEGIDIFTFGYGNLKSKLQKIFGETVVIDC